MEKVYVGHNRKSHIHTGVISVCFGLTALWSLGTIELWRQNFYKKNKLWKGVFQSVCAYGHFVCFHMLSPPQCIRWVSMKGYIDEMIAWLQSVIVNEQSVHDIISPLTCAVIHLCLLWKTWADEEWKEQALEYNSFWKNTGLKRW